MSDDPTRYDPYEDPTRREQATRPEEKLPLPEQPIPRRGYEGQPRPMSPPPQRPYTPPPSVTPPPPAPSRYAAQRPAAEPVARPRMPRPPRSKEDSGLYLPWWSLVILIVVVGAGAILLLLAALNFGESFVLGDQTPQVIVVTNALQANNAAAQGGVNPPPVVTPGGVPPTAAPIASAVPTAEPSRTALPGVTTGCPLNGVMEVVGTAPVGLSIRSEPRQGNNILAVAQDGERFRIVGGPQNTTGVGGVSIEWCEVEGITNENRTGWAARQYLAEVTE